MGPGAEFDLIRRLVQGWGPRAAGIGDDAAVLHVPEGSQLVATTDAAVDRVHFRRDWSSPDEIGWRAATAAISDTAAMAATPIGVLIALAVPDDCRDLLEPLARGMGDAVAAADTVIVGGNIARAGELSITTTVMAHARRPLMRTGARPGEAIYVTGRLGGPAAAVAAWVSGQAPGAEAQARYARPAARIREARWLAERGATAAVDISDGLLADVGHVAHASGVRIELELDDLPVVNGVPIDHAARGGDEYEIVVSAPPGLDCGAFHATFGILLTPIGIVLEGAPAVEARLAGDRVAPGGGWDHLS
jgi:thiamine-monophosphate kinase